MTNSRRRRLTVTVTVSVAILVAVALLCLTPVEPKPVANAEYPMLAAHRGGLEQHPENTLEAFDAVRNEHPDMALEMDVRVLGDGTLVIWHDEDLERLSADGDTADLASLDAAAWGDVGVRNPRDGASADATTLEAVLDRYAGDDVMLLIELKDPVALESFVEAVLPVKEQVIVQSFHTTALEGLVASGLYTLQLSTSTEVDLVDGVHSVGIQNSALTPSAVEKLRGADVRIWAWGDDVVSDMLKRDDRRLDGYMVNQP